ncbi:hypothetical protein [Roseimaritima sediminicola]|uniref:hypothetical protein n=1 Tax=Roseimaritima sediminicola TaxID=2662066 RepID=UPI0012982896|nr:hypothetical protein [Roseimaritima sediminicola]
MSDPNSPRQDEARGPADIGAGSGEVGSGEVGSGELVNPYQPVGSVTVPEQLPKVRGEINQHSQDVNRVLGITIGVLVMLGFFVWLAQGAPLFVALILMSPFFPAPLLFLLRPCRHAWWSDMLINFGLSVGVGVAVIIAGVAICTAILVGIGGL